MAEKITLAKKCRRDTVILLFMSAITSAFAECRRELERLLVKICKIVPPDLLFFVAFISFYGKMVAK